MTVFKVGLVSVASLLFLYMSHRTIAVLDLSLGVQALFGAALFLPVALFLAQPLYFWSHRDRPDSGVFYFFQKSVHFALPYLNYFFFLVLFRDLLTVAGGWLGFSLFQYNWIESVVIGLLPIILFLLGHSVVLRGPQVLSHQIQSKKISSHWRDFRLVQISDLHLGSSITVAFVRKMVERVNRLEPNVIVFTGDLFDGTEAGMKSQIAELKKLKAKEAILFCTGNHEYYWDYRKLSRLLDDLKMVWLNNSQYEIRRGEERMSFFGIPDSQAVGFGHEGPDWDKLSLLFDHNEYRILLCHQPFMFDEAAQRGFDLQLSGHTHGGQFFPWNFLIRFFQKYVKGFYRKGDSLLYVNQGTAHWGPPDRLGTKCEITQLTFEPAVVG